MKILTKKEFREGINQGKIDVRPTNECYINGNKYMLEVEQFKDEVRLIKVD